MSPSFQHQGWKLIELLNRSEQRLLDLGVEDARICAERLLAHTLNLNRLDLYLNFDRPLSQDEVKKFFSFVQRRLNHEPLQYILGQTEFMSLPFTVNPNVLIPRPETEVLVEATIREVKKRFPDDKPVQCLDIGTGSGNIAVSLARYLTNIAVMAIDIDESALSVARENAEKNGVSARIHFCNLDAMSNDFITHIHRSFDVVVSNPPYVSKNDYEKLPKEIRLFEPKRALDGGADGLKFYKGVRKHLFQLLKSHGIALFEIGASQANDVRSVFSAVFKNDIKIFPDLADRDRVVALSRST